MKYAPLTRSNSLGSPCVSLLRLYPYEPLVYTPVAIHLPLLVKWRPPFLMPVKLFLLYPVFFSCLSNYLIAGLNLVARCAHLL